MPEWARLVANLAGVNSDLMRQGIYRSVTIMGV
jgi:hypothetical protein